MFDVRCYQEFGQFEKTLFLLKDAISIDKPSVVERAGLVHFFELAFELSRDLLKRLKETLIMSPSEPNNEAIQRNLIRHCNDWADEIGGLNLTQRIYDEDTAIEVEQKIRLTYFPLLQQLYEDLVQMGKR